VGHPVLTEIRSKKWDTRTQKEPGHETGLYEKLRKRLYAGANGMGVCPVLLIADSRHGRDTISYADCNLPASGGHHRETIGSQSV